MPSMKSTLFISVGALASTALAISGKATTTVSFDTILEIPTHIRVSHQHRLIYHSITLIINKAHVAADSDKEPVPLCSRGRLVSLFISSVLPPSFTINISLTIA